MAEEKEDQVDTAERENEDAIFEKIMSHVGMKGRFQLRFNILFNLLFVLLVAWPYMNMLLAMTVPDHWCHVPGRNNTNLTEQQWKELTLPRHKNGKSFSQCSMYNLSYPFDLRPSTKGVNIIGCQRGWEYDTTWYTMTIPSQEDWVCEQELKVTNTFAMSRLGDVIGTFIFGQLADNIGRRPVFFLVLALLIVARMVSLFTVSNFTWYLVASFFANLSVSSVFQSPLVLSMEVSANDKRAQIAMMQCLGWTAGICILPMIAWAVGDWFVFMVITTLPAGAYLFLYRYFPESPRWLATRGKPDECMKSLRLIASVNGTTLSDDTQKMLNQLAIHKEKTYGLASLFSSWRLAKNTIIIVISWVVNSLVYYVLVLNVTNMAGNPFMNFFWQSLVELPAYIMGRLLTDRYGRRWTQSVMFLIFPVVCCFIAYFIKDPSYEWLCVSMAVALKFLVTATFYVVYLQAMEIYPTCVRQTGTSFGTVVANALGVLGPYIVYLGTAHDARYPFIFLGVITLIGGVCTAFLPETLHQKLPETLTEAQHFGEDQSFWLFQDYIRVKQEETSQRVCDVPLKEEIKSAVV